jgi:NAD(P)-dependent dehydrogenase (short-subunit alcohol dehydrogenase family)
MSKVRFIKGASRGFGFEFAKAALQRGDQVAAPQTASSAACPTRATYA